MKYDTLKISGSCMTNEILNSLWCVVREEAKVHIPLGSMDNGSISKRGECRTFYWMRRRDGLFLPCGTFVEDIAIPLCLVVPSTL